MFGCSRSDLSIILHSSILPISTLQTYLVQSGNKYDQVLRLLHNEYGTGTAKRAATETIGDEATDKEVEVIKKRKVTPSAKMMYTTVEKKMNAVTPQRYQ